jgi:hypothetical protein
MTFAAREEFLTHAVCAVSLQSPVIHCDIAFVCHLLGRTAYGLSVGVPQLLAAGGISDGVDGARSIRCYLCQQGYARRAVLLPAEALASHTYCNDNSSVKTMNSSQLLMTACTGP